MSQPTVLDAWCTLCFASAAISLAMIGPAVDKMLASQRYLRRERERGNSFWAGFWGRGDARAGGRRCLSAIAGTLPKDS
jgi:hypothetical protein